MPLSPITTDGEHSYLGESRGRLHLIVAGGLWLLRFSVFELQQDYSSWFAMCDINLDAGAYTVVPRNMFPSHFRSYLMSCAIQRDEESGELELIVVLPWGNAVLYNLEERRERRIRCSNINFNLLDQIGCFRVCCPYFETLSFIDEESNIGEATVVFEDDEDLSVSLSDCISIFQSFAP